MAPSPSRGPLDHRAPSVCHLAPKAYVFIIWPARWQQSLGAKHTWPNQVSHTPNVAVVDLLALTRQNGLCAQNRLPYCLMSVITYKLIATLTSSTFEWDTASLHLAFYVNSVSLTVPTQEKEKKQNEGAADKRHRKVARIHTNWPGAVHCAHQSVSPKCAHLAGR